MGSLRTRLIRLAHERPELRPQLLPLIRSAEGPEPAYVQSMVAIEDLKDLDRVLQKAFGRFRLEPDFKPGADLMGMAREGSNLARMARAALADLVDLYPTDNRYVLAYTAANQMDVEMATRIEEIRIMLKSGR